MIACVGGGSNAIGIFIPFVDDADVELIGVEAAGEGIDDRPPRRAADDRRAAAASCTAPTRRSCRTRTARSSRRTRSRPGSTIPAPAPSTPTCATAAAPATWRSPTRRRSRRCAASAELEGIIPALESSHAVAWALRGDAGPDTLDLVCLSGRGDKDLAEVLPKLGLAESSQVDVRARASTASPPRSRRRPGRAALMPYLMGGFPDLEASVAIGEACADAGADLVELGVPFSDPLADGPVIHAAGHARAGGGRHAARRARRRHADRRAPAGRAHVLREPDLRARRRAVRGRARRRRRQRADRARPAARGGRGRSATACDAAGLALVPLIAPTTPDDRLADDRPRRAWIRLHGLGHRDHRRAGRRATARWPPRSRARSAHSPVPVAVGFGISTPEQAAAAAATGADGVIVGSRLVRAAAEAADAGGRPRPRSASWSRRSPTRSAARLRAAHGRSAHPHRRPRRLGRPLGARRQGGFDAFMITVLMLVVAAAGHIVAPYLPGHRREG